MTDETTGRRRGRIGLIAIGIGFVAALAVPPLVRGWLARDLCPTVIETSGGQSGHRWEIARSTCEAGRVVHQLRVIPEKGVSTLVYEVEGGPLPIGWSQSGFVGKLELATPFAGEANLVVDVPLDPKGRPKAPIRARDGRRLD